MSIPEVPRMDSGCPNCGRTRFVAHRIGEPPRAECKDCHTIYAVAEWDYLRREAEPLRLADRKRREEAAAAQFPVQMSAVINGHRRECLGGLRNLTTRG